MKSSVLKSKNQIIKKNLPRINFRSLTKENEEVVNEYKRKSNDENTVKETEAKKLRKKEQSVYFETVAEEVNKLCSICSNDHPPSKERKLKWIDCHVCNKLAHEVYAFNSSCQNIRKNSWLCDKDE